MSSALAPAASIAFFKLSASSLDKPSLMVAGAPSTKSFASFKPRPQAAFDASDVDYEPLYDSLKGSTAVMFTQTANVPAKLLKEYQKEGIPALKAAYAEESIYVGADKLAELAALKSKNEVIAEIVALLQSPAKNVVSALQSGANTIHGVLKTLGERPE